MPIMIAWAAALLFFVGYAGGIESDASILASIGYGVLTVFGAVLGGYLAFKITGGW